jgi:hypothetical protein
LRKNEKSDEEKLQLVNVRVPKNVLAAFDKTCQKGMRADKIRSMLQQEAEKSGNEVEVVITYKKLIADAESCRREMDRIKKSMNDRFQLVEAAALKNIPLTTENISSIIQELISYPISREAEFDRFDTEDYIKYLYAWQEHQGLLKQIDSQREQAGIIKPGVSLVSSEQDKEPKKRRYISPKNRCCGNHSPQHS